jgi:hypothetical protein
MMLYNGLIVLIEFGFDEFRIVFDQASKTNAEIFAGFGFNIGGIPTRWGSHLIRNSTCPFLDFGLFFIFSRQTKIPTRWGSHLIGKAQFSRRRSVRSIKKMIDPAIMR